jgi:hypothetical protein
LSPRNFDYIISAPWGTSKNSTGCREDYKCQDTGRIRSSRTRASHDYTSGSESQNFPARNGTDELPRQRPCAPTEHHYSQSQQIHTNDLEYTRQEWFLEEKKKELVSGEWSFAEIPVSPVTVHLCCRPPLKTLLK